MDPVIPAFTAQKMIEIEDGFVVGAQLMSDHLILTQKNGGIIDAGNVKGLKGRDPGGVTTISGNVDIDTLLEVGWYEISRVTTKDESFTYHYPVPGAALLHVVRNALNNMIWQTYHIYRGGSFVGSTWTRAYYGGVWTEWQGIGGSDWKPLTGLPTYNYFETYGGSYAPPEYRIFGSTVYLRGLLKATRYLGTQNSTTIATTPPDAPPSTRYIFSLAMGPMLTVDWTTVVHYHIVDRQNGRVDVFPAGDGENGYISVTVNWSSANPGFNMYFEDGDYLSLSKISYQWQ